MTDKRSAVTHVYWTEDEKKAVEAHAKKLGMPLAIYLRTLALGEIVKEGGADGAKSSKR